MANEEFNSVPCGDQYTDVATIRDVFDSGGGTFEVQDQPAKYILQFGGLGVDSWTQEATVGTGGGAIPPGVTGVRFRNATAGSVATASALIRHRSQPHLSLAFPAPPSLASGAVITAFDKLLTVAAANFDTGAVIPAGSHALLCYLQGRSDAAVGSTYCSLQMNGDAGANYEWSYIQVDNTAAVVGNAAGGVNFIQGHGLPGAVSGAGEFAPIAWTIPLYDGAANFKELTWENHFANGAAFVTRFGHGAWRSLAPITRLTITPAAGNFAAGSRFTVLAI